MERKVKYAMTTTLNLPYEAAVEKVKEALKAEGFGVLTTIDVKETLKQKLGVDYKKYLILGACNPPLAYQAIQAEEEIGVLMPCNVLVYEGPGGKSVVTAMDPGGAMALVENPKFAEVAKQGTAKMERVMAALDALG